MATHKYGKAKTRACRNDCLMLAEASLSFKIWMIAACGHDVPAKKETIMINGAANSHNRGETKAVVTPKNCIKAIVPAMINTLAK